MALPGLVAAKNLADVADRERAWDNLGREFVANFDTPPLALAPGTRIGGGYFAGYISHTADGNATHALIVASRVPSNGKAGARGVGYSTAGNLEWALTGLAAGNSLITGIEPGQLLTDYNARKEFDGAVNIAIMKANLYGLGAYPAAQYVDDLNSGEGFGGQTDWYLPSRLELDIAYFNLKPSTVNNVTTTGANPYSVPRRDNNYTLVDPSQTGLTTFNTSTEQFVPGFHWSSTEGFPSETRALLFSFSNGSQISNAVKTQSQPVRAFRKITL
jgi:hypothetical protein